MITMRRIALLAASLLLMATATAQERPLLSRAALDSLMNSPLSAHSGGVIKASTRHIELGEIDNSKPLEYRLMLHNTSSSEVRITRLHANCSCLSIEPRTLTLKGHASEEVCLKLNTAGRSQHFSYQLLIYTAEDDRLPAERVTIEGRIRSSDRWSHLPHHAGGLRMSRREVVLTPTTPTERIAMGNSTAHSLTITATTTLRGLTFGCEPESLEAGMEGDIVIGYHGEWPREPLTTIVIINGIEGRASERMIKVRIECDKR